VKSTSIVETALLARAGVSYRFALLVLIAALGAGEASAAPILYSSGGQAPGGVFFDQTGNLGGGGGASFDIVSFRAADGFTLTDLSVVQGINFNYAFFGADLSSVTYAIYNAIDPSTIGSLIQSETISGANITTTSDPGTCVNCAVASFAITDLSLDVGTYFLEIHAGDTLQSLNGGNDVAWVTANGAINALYSDNSGGAGGVPNTDSGVQTAFQLTGVQMPEPGTFGLLALGAGLIGFKARRRLVK
jgi:hypothetical protein